jgi:hypothetical protein
MSQLSSIGAVIIVSMIPAVTYGQTLSHPYVRNEAVELACGPQAALVPSSSTLRVSGSFDPKKALFANGDVVTIAGGTTQGVQPGQVYFVRRAVPDRFTVPTVDGVTVSSIHTAGWLRIDEAQSDVSVGTITLACDGIETGDYLEPFELPKVPAAKQSGEPDFSAPGHFILGDDRRQMGGQGSLMVIDRGSDHGLKAGQRLTIYRETMGGRGPVSRVGEATVVIVSPEHTLVRIESTRDAVFVGDLVAVQR